MLIGTTSPFRSGCFPSTILIYFLSTISGSTAFQSSASLAFAKMKSSSPVISRLFLILSKFSQTIIVKFVSIFFTSSSSFPLSSINSLFFEL